MTENVQRVILTADDRTRAAFSSFRASIKEATQSTNTLSNASALLKRGLGAIGVGFSVGSVISSTKEMETALVGVSKTTGLTGQELDNFSKRISRVSTGIPVATGELLELAEAAGQMGVTGAENLEKFSVTVAKLGRASDLSGAQAATSLARILNVTKESVDSVDTLASVIVSLGGKVAASESEIARMTTEVARATSQFGVSSAEAAAMSAAMASIGIQAELGGSAVGRVMQEITSRVQAGGEDLQQFADVLNLNSETLAKLFAENKTAALEFFLREVGELGLDAGNALKEVGLGGQEIAKTAIPLANNVDRLTETLRLANEEVKDATALDREFEATLKTLDSQWQVSKNIVAGYAKTIGGVLVPALKSGLQAFNDFFGAAETSAIDSQIALISNLESKLESLRARNTGLDGVIPGASKVFGTNKKEFDLLEFQLESEREKLQQLRSAAKDLEDQLPKTSVKVEELNEPLGETGGLAGKAADKAAQFIAQLQKESKQAGLTASEIKKLEAATLGVSKVADPLIDQIDQTNKELEEQRKIARLVEDDLRKIESITKSVRTEEEKFADEVRELDRLLEAGLGPEAHARELQRLEDQLRDVSNTTAKVTDEFSRLWDQAGRNIQSTLADGIFNFFDNGLKGMLKSVISTTGRIASEFAALSLARGVGLGTLFAGGAAGAAGASASGGGIDAFSLASTGINAASLLNSGFGATSLIGGALSGAGSFFGSGSLTAFGEAFAGDAIAGFAGAAGGIGASLGAAAGPAIVLFAADQIGRLLAGDKKTGTFVDKVPVIGGFASALFGLGPAKFRQQFLGGNVSEEGFQDGFVTDVFRRKGGLLRGNKHSQQDAANADEILSLFDDSIKAFFGSTRALAENLNLDARALDDLTLNVAIQSEKKKVISQEQISAEITRLSDAIAGSVLPNISDLTRGNETYAATLSRIGSELDSLSNIMLLLGRSTEDARTELLGLSIDERTQLTDKLGGVQNANASFDSFFNNFLSPQDQLEILSDKLLTELAAVDINRIVSPEEVADAFLSGTLSVDHITAALNPAMQALILKVDALKTSVEGATPSVEELAQKQLQGVDTAFGALQASADAERNKLTVQYNESVKQVNQSIGTLTALSGALKSSIETINPLDLDQARNNLRGAIAQASSGNIVDLNSVRTSLSVLSKNDTRAFRTREEFIRSQEENTSLLDQLGGITDDQLSAQERSLEVLQIGFDGELARLDSIVEGAQRQIDLLQGIHNSIQSSGVGGSLADFNTLSVAAGGSAIAGPGGSLPFNGNRNITGAQIQEFLAVNDNPFDIYNAARDNNVSGLQLAANSPFTIEQINQFADDNGLPRLNVGTNFIPRDMPAFLHQGEEVKPKAFVDSERAERKKLIDLMSKVLKATEVSTVSNNKVKRILDKWEKVGMPEERKRA